ncbi:hypothetical protein Ndes2526B_g06265 [Nannochloris sp. 'desiccata']|nr:hypothetical protein KSW81_008040 [Chlorella desiccata (nom. nud.)]KAH7619300.1 putative Magnesium transporter MRS2-C [Chlorella desiccata (nom. nud.)]
MAGRYNEDLSEPLLNIGHNDLNVAEEGQYNQEGPPLAHSDAGSMEPTPSWLSERQGPLQDSPGVYQTIGIGNMIPPMQERIIERPYIPKYSRSKRLAPARARRQPWIVIDETGRRSFLHADKRAIIHTTGLNIPIRDMRLLDFNLGASDSTILVRDNALIVSMEHVRFIVTADRAIIPREGTDQNPLTARFVDILEDTIGDWTRQKKNFEEQQAHEYSSTMGAAAAAAVAAVGDGGASSASGEPFLGPGTVSDYDETSSMHHELQQPLPFELVVLEAALKEVVASQSLQIKELEGVALPALDALTRTINSANLELTRKVKTRHQRLTLRTEALRDELQRFLQDDDDMADMCLTRRKEIEETAKAVMAGSSGDMGGTGGVGVGQEEYTPPPATAFAPSSLTRRGSLHLARFQHHVGSPPRLASALPSREVFLSMGRANSSGGPQAAAAAAAAAEEDADAEAQQDVENLLESYYMQVDGLYDKLVSVGEYIKDTEEYINIELDSSRNRLIRFEIVLSVATFSIMPFNLLAGVLGENLIIPEQITGSVSQFFGVNIAATAFCFFIFNAITLYMRYTKLI